MPFKNFEEIVAMILFYLFFCEALLLMDGYFICRKSQVFYIGRNCIIQYGKENLCIILFLQNLQPVCLECVYPYTPTPPSTLFSSSSSSLSNYSWLAMTSTFLNMRNPKIFFQPFFVMFLRLPSLCVG
ncbi:unnamed protein product [Arctogadus glacialis]